MTTIAWDGTTLAADTLVTADGYIIGYTTKIGRTGDLLYGAAGVAPECQSFENWIRNGAKYGHPNIPDAQGFVIMPDNLIVTFGKNGQIDHLRASRYTNGSGWQYAMGAMLLGCDAPKAVAIAIACDTHSGGSITTIKR